jgi:hypothetical protein
MSWLHFSVSGNKIIVYNEKISKTSKLTLKNKKTVT